MTSSRFPSVVQIRLRLSNAFLIKGDRAVLVDTGCGNESGAIVRALKREQVDVAGLSLVLHTHGHGDHCGSTRELRRWTQAPTAVHAGDAHMLRRGRNDPLIPTCFTARLIRPFLAQTFPRVRPDIELQGNTDLEAFGVACRVLHTPGHTAGSISIVTAAGDAIVGDLLMGGYLGGKVLPARPRFHYYADDVARERREIVRVLALATSRVYVGHGGPLRPDDIRRVLGPSLDLPRSISHTGA